ncbi:vitelline membrane protein Vm26Aa-like [Eupeodes corollae]|uniref:vitelline membrane protein Vm26Aa-like n=1 Tax=Eupeodes corollae TaxID=290404 RepID=UPI002491CB71|nr:vitelline membrane protein Vm26Aa-like [Eupeodes corollae]
MQSFIVFALFVSVATAASLGSSQQGVPQNILHTLTEESNMNGFAAPSDLARSKKSAYGAPAPSYSAPPCPKNYLFSCQPSVAPVPCAPGGYAGAYSVPVPTYALPSAPQFIPQELLRPYNY